MKPLLINTYDRGGAARACLRLHSGLLYAGYESKILLKRKTQNFPNTYQISITAKRKNLVDRVKTKLECLGLKFKTPIQKLQKQLSRPNNLEMISLPLSEYDITKSELYQQANIINLHWVADFLDYPTFFKQNTKPIVWTFHDQNPFLGLEHYKEEFAGIDRDGYPIKRKITKQELKVYDYYFKIKANAYKFLQNTPYKIVTPSNWLKQEAINSGLFDENNIIHIPNGVDSKLFKPIEKKLARKILNLPDNKIIILFVADSLSNFRKGFAFLYRVIQQLNNDRILFVSVGNNPVSDSPDNYLHLGYVHDQLLLPVIYSAADAFVIPSLIDNLPNTAIESLMCGTPVIGFPSGGIKEIIKHSFNGLIAEEISVNALYGAILQFMDTRSNFDSIKIRNTALNTYDLKLQTKRYLEIFKNLIRN